MLDLKRDVVLLGPSGSSLSGRCRSTCRWVLATPNPAELKSMKSVVGVVGRTVVMASSFDLFVLYDVFGQLPHLLYVVTVKVSLNLPFECCLHFTLACPDLDLWFLVYLDIPGFVCPL